MGMFCRSRTSGPYEYTYFCYVLFYTAVERRYVDYEECAAACCVGLVRGGLVCGFGECRDWLSASVRSLASAHGSSTVCGGLYE